MWIENALLKLALYVCEYIAVQNPDQVKAPNDDRVPKDDGHHKTKLWSPTCL